MGFVDVAATQEAVCPVASGTHFKPAQHGAKPAPHDCVSALHVHAPKASPWPRCAGIAFSPTIISCAFAVLPGGRWQTVTFAAAATWGMRAIAANTRNAAHIVRVLDRQSTRLNSSHGYNSYAV